MIGLLVVRNRYHTLSTDHLRFVAIKEVDGYPVVEAELNVPRLLPGQMATITVPDDLVAPGDGEIWLIIKAELAAETALGRSWSRGGARPIRADQTGQHRAAASLAGATRARAR